MMTVNHFLLVYQRKRQTTSVKEQGTANEAAVKEHIEEQQGLEALTFTQQSQKCGIFDFLCMLMVKFFFIAEIVAAYDIWFFSSLEAGWILLRFLLTILVDLFILRLITIIIVAAVRSTYFKSVDPTGAGYEAGLLDEAGKAAWRKSLKKVNMKIN